MSEVVPIRPGLSAEGSGIAALIDYAAESIKTFAEHDEPLAIGLAIIGRKKMIPLGYVTAEGKTLAEVMALSGALFINRVTQPE